MNAPAFTTHRDAEIDIVGTFMCGTIQASRRQLIAAFGEPALKDAGQNVTVEWKLVFYATNERTFARTVAAIYDWKRYEIAGIDEAITWHIGGHNRVAVECVHEVFRKALAKTTQEVP